MYNKIARPVNIILLLIFLSQNINAQEWCDNKCKLSIGVISIGSGLDIHSSLGKRELNPIARNMNGEFNPTKGIVFKSIGIGSTLIFQKKYPKKMFIIRMIAGGVYTGIAIRNYRIKE